MKQTAKKMNSQFMVALLVVVVFALLVILFQQGFFAPRPAVKAARPLAGNMPVVCYNQSVNQNTSYNAYVVALDQDSEGKYDSFGFDADNSGSVDFFIYTGNFNPNDVLYSTADDQGDIEATITDVMVHTLGAYDDEINGVLDRLSVVAEGSAEETALNEYLDKLFAEEDKVAKGLNLLPVIGGFDSVILPCGLLGLESFGVYQ